MGRQRHDASRCFKTLRVSGDSVDERASADHDFSSSAIGRSVVRVVVVVVVVVTAMRVARPSPFRRESFVWIA
ncbi:MAG TPA: hypothetical protein DCQ98_00560 [Planctomycetaceae bacterium]|nr:hypothetical protein [Planctomycetaceae bacterium]